MLPTETAGQASLTFTLPEGTGTLEFKHEEPSTEHDVTTHHKCFRVRQGFVRVTIGNTTRIYGPGDRDFVIWPCTPHSFNRADCSSVRIDKEALAARDEEAKGWRDVEVVMEEWTVPADGAKEVFFRNVVSLYLDEIEPVARHGPGLRHVPALFAGIIQILAFLSNADTYILMVGSWDVKKDGTVNLLGRIFTYAVLAFAILVNLLLGGRLWYKEYIPRRLWPLCVESMGGP